MPGVSKCLTRAVGFARSDQTVAKALVVPLIMIMREKFVNGFSLRAFSE